MSSPPSVSFTFESSPSLGKNFVFSNHIESVQSQSPRYFLILCLLNLLMTPVKLFICMVGLGAMLVLVPFRFLPQSQINSRSW